MDSGMNTSMDTIYLRDIELSVTIGAFAWEQQISQKLLLSLTLKVDTRPAAASDQLSDALDYGAVLARVQALAAELSPERPVQLIETLADRIARTILGEFAKVQSVTVDLAKVFIFPQVPRIGVVIERSR
jgi:7,8-dihydroneopterin aldolase/epimerase/oxygenase